MVSESSKREEEEIDALCASKSFRFCMAIVAEQAITSVVATDSKEQQR